MLNSKKGQRAARGQSAIRVSLRDGEKFNKNKIKKMAKYSERSLKNLIGLRPELVHIMMEAIKETPIDYTITNGLRTQEEQQKLYAQGRTEMGYIVTNIDGIKNKSKHQEGRAVDLYPYINGGIQLNDEQSLGIIAQHIKKTASRLGYKITWGGEWKYFKDKPHFEI